MGPVAGRCVAVSALLVSALSATPALAADGGPAAVCRRPLAGAVAAAPPELFSRNGVLNVALDYVTSKDGDRRTLFCFVTPDGLESPTLHIRPGDTLNVTLSNRLPVPPPGAPGGMVMSVGRDVCGAAVMNASSVNLHFHGSAALPVCHSDEVLHTLVNAGERFVYRVKIPATETPGLYWYHPHVHGQSEGAVLGGASGAIVVDGVEALQPIVAGLSQRLLVIRDQVVAGGVKPGGKVPAWDLSLNYVPIAWPAQIPAVIAVKPGRREFWRVLNASADTIADIHLSYDGVDQPLEVVGLDGVPTGSGDGKGPGKVVTMTHILIPAAGRAEFVITAPSAQVTRATLETRAIDTGPDGDNDTARTLARLQVDTTPAADAEMSPSMPMPMAPPLAARSDGLRTARLTARRKLYLSEAISDPKDPSSSTDFFVTVEGARPRLFDPAAAPAIVTRQGAVEEWTIENRAREVHEFHIHQIHFKLLRRDGRLLAPDQRQYLDTVELPYWRGTGPYPSATLLMDFRGKVTGDLPYHCHMLQHEDGGMMGIVRVLPRAARRDRRRGSDRASQRL